MNEDPVLEIARLSNENQQLREEISRLTSMLIAQWPMTKDIPASVEAHGISRMAREALERGRGRSDA